MPVGQQLIPSEQNDIVAFSFDELHLNHTNVINMAPQIHEGKQTATFNNSRFISLACTHRRVASHTSSYRGRHFSMSGRVTCEQPLGPVKVPAWLWTNWGA